MQNELECLGDREGHDSHLAKKFLKLIASCCQVMTAESLRGKRDNSG